ncbi:Sec-independent protein translocase protein TatC [Streptomyces inusitatus]|uniref:Sec-independent protein translocase protein TatC n=2 Tax=Streptomyces inusitatus TaxID=68221 RepID=A0A918QDJ6_9ACTN|nr:Sec-independent protein translocase protein TatC [Streptomyces inusitatus]
MLKPARSKSPEKDPEGRMPLAEHLRELRNRLAKGLLAIVVMSIIAVFYNKQLMDFLAAPVPACEKGQSNAGGQCAEIVFNKLLSPFTTTIKVTLLAGFVLSCPVWLYQLWAFVAPGLHKSEKKYTYYFVTAAVPLFLSGAYLAYLIMPISFEMLLKITPDAAGNLLELDDVLDFSVRMVLVFGLAFELPLILIMLNLVGLVTGRRMSGWWRGVIMGVFVFGAIATPTTDPIGMIALSGPIVVLYFAAVGFSLLNDKRRARRDPDAALDDDEASPLDLDTEPVTAGHSLPEQSKGESDGARTHRVNGYDDIT